MNLLAFKSWRFFFCLLATGSSLTAIAALTSTVNRTTTNLQPLVPIGTVPSSNGSVPTTKWPRPDSTDHCTITKRCYYTGSDSHSTGSSRSRPTTGTSTDNGIANVERSIPSFFGGMNQIRELILWSTFSRSVVYSRTLTSQPPLTSRTLAFLNRTFQCIEPKLTSLFQLNTFSPLLNSVFLIFR